MTTHGFALNVDPDLGYFDRIVPCGMPDVPVTSMAAAGASAGVADAARALTAHFAEIFGVDVESAGLYEVMRAARPPGEQASPAADPFDTSHSPAGSHS